MNKDECANGQGGIGTQPVHQNMAGWTLALERFGNWLITAPNGDAARVFHDDDAPLATVMRQFLQAMVFGGEAIVAPGSQADAAVRTLTHMGYSWNGGTMWRPPLGAVPKFMQDTVDRVNAAAGLKPLPGETACNFRNRILAQADAPLETSEDEAKPYVPAMASLQAAYEATAGVRAALDKLGEAVGDGQIVDADYWAGDEEAISKALLELDEIAQAYDRHDMGLPLWLPEQHEKLAKVLRKMLADQRAALAQQNRAESIPYQVEVKFSASDATKMVEAAIAASGYPWTAAARDVLAERRRQQEVEGWTPESDDRYIDCDLARAAATYALCTKAHELKVCDVVAWPWPIHWWKPTTYRNNLKKAGALILAEIERLDRAAEKGGAA